MTTQDLNIRARVLRAAAAACVLAIAGLTVGSDANAAPSAPGAEASPVEMVQTPLLPRQTRHIIKFHRLGLA